MTINVSKPDVRVDRDKVAQLLTKATNHNRNGEDAATAAVCQVLAMYITGTSLKLDDQQFVEFWMESTGVFDKFMQKKREERK